MESYVERWAKEKAQKEQKERKPKKVRKNSVYGEMRKEGQKDGTDTRSEGHEAQAESSGGQ